MVDVRRYPRRSRRGHPTWVTEHQRRPMTVRLMTAEMRLAKPTNLAGFTTEHPDVIFLGPQARRASPETIARVLGHESIHAAGLHIGEWNDEAIDPRGERARTEYGAVPGNTVPVAGQPGKGIARDVNDYIESVMEPSGLYRRHARLR